MAQFLETVVARRQAADAYRESGDLLEAIGVYNQILKMDPDLVEARIDLAECYKLLGLTDEALAQYESAARWYENAGDASAGAQLRQIALKLDEAARCDVRSLLRDGDRHAGEGDLGEAVVAYRQAADAYWERGEVLKALAVYKQILELDPGQVGVRMKLAEGYRVLGLADEPAG